MGPHHAVACLDRRRRDRQPGPRAGHSRSSTRRSSTNRSAAIFRLPQSRIRSHESRAIRQRRDQAAADRSRERSSIAAERIACSSAERRFTQTSRCSVRVSRPRPIRRAGRVPRRSCCFWPTVSRRASTTPAFSGRWADGCSTGSGRKARASSGPIPVRTKRFACGTSRPTPTCRRPNRWMRGTSSVPCSSFREIPRCSSSRPARASGSADRRFRTSCSPRRCRAISST